MIVVVFFLQPDAMNMIPAQMQIPGLDMSANLHNSATEVLCLMNMVEIEELMDDEEYEGNDWSKADFSSHFFQTDKWTSCENNGKHP